MSEEELEAIEAFDKAKKNKKNETMPLEQMLKEVDKERKKVQYTDEPISANVIKDFLPSFDN